MIGYDLFELTSSGLSFYMDSINFVDFFEYSQVLVPTTFNERKDMFNGVNYGMLEIDSEVGVVKL